MSRGLEIAILGAVGLNGDNLLQLIGERGLPVARLHALDSGDYLGRKVDFGGKLVALDDYNNFAFNGVDLAIACSPLPPELIALTGLEVRDPDADLGELCVRPIVAEERLGWRLYMERYHYLGDRPIVGEHLLYAAVLGDELVALLGSPAAP